MVNLRLAQTLAERAPERSRAVLAEQVAAVDAAIGTLVDLARGLYPRTLVEHGVGPALREVSGGTGAPISVTDQDVARLPSDIEAALYFFAVEAIQNAVKHARASAIAVDLTSDGRRVSLQVRDDGRGFETTAGSTGHGLGNMRDRIDAMQGTFTLESVPGRGATVNATVPVPVGAEAAS